MTLSLLWRPGWQASSGVLSDATELFTGNSVDLVTAYGTVLTPAAVTLVCDLGGSFALTTLLLNLSYLRNSAVLMETGTTGGGSTTVNSSVFNVPIAGGGNTSAVNLSIPPGTYSGASWSLTGHSTGFDNDYVGTVSDTSANPFTAHAGGAFAVGPIAATAAELSDINAAAVGSGILAASVTCSAAPTVTGCTLTLTLTGSGGGVTYTGATVSQWLVWSGSAWVNIASADATPGTYTWASNHGNVGGGLFAAKLATTTETLRISVSDTASADAHIDVGFFNVMGPAITVPSSQLQGGVLIANPFPNPAAAIAANPALAATA